MIDWRKPDRTPRNPRNTATPAARREARNRAEAEGLARVRDEAKAQREKTARLKKLRLEKDGD